MPEVGGCNTNATKTSGKGDDKNLNKKEGFYGIKWMRDF
jgi:hypothetical protein